MIWRSCRWSTAAAGSRRRVCRTSSSGSIAVATSLSWPAAVSGWPAPSSSWSSMAARSTSTAGLGKVQPSRCACLCEARTSGRTCGRRALLLQQWSHLRQVPDKQLHLNLARLIVGRAQDGGRVDRGQDVGCQWRANQLAPLLGYAELIAQQRLCGCGAEAHDDPRPDGGDLRLQPGAASRDFASIWLLVDTSLAARLPFEVLDGVGHVHLVTIDAGSFERLIQQLARRPDERPALAILIVARLLAHHHQLGRGAALTEHRLRAALVQITAAALSGSLPERGKRVFPRQERLGRTCRHEGCVN